MSITIRAPTPEEADRFFFISQYSFDGDRGEEERQRQVERWPLERCLAAVEGGEVVAGLRIQRLTMRINGGAICLGGVADVACLPEHRRSGHVGRLLAASIEKQRADGQPLSGLGTPFPEVYRKYGWEYANLGLLCKFSPNDVAVRRHASRGKARRVTADEWQTLDALYRRYIAQRNGYIDRAEVSWREHVIKSFGATGDIALWEEEGGATGYMVYIIRQHISEDRPWPRSFISVRDFVALTPDALSGLLAFLLSHDRALHIYMRIPPDFPLSSAFTDPNRVHVEAEEHLMLRIVDFKAAIEARPALPIANGASFTVRVHDRHAPWNDGTWRVEAAEGKCAVEQTASAPDLECDIRDFAPVYAAHRTPRSLAETGAIAVHDAAALDAAERIFAATCAPWTPDWW